MIRRLEVNRRFGLLGVVDHGIGRERMGIMCVVEQSAEVCVHFLGHRDHRHHHFTVEGERREFNYLLNLLTLL